MQAHFKMWKGYNTELPFRDKTFRPEFWMLLFMLWISSFGTNMFVVFLSGWLFHF